TRSVPPAREEAELHAFPISRPVTRPGHAVVGRNRSDPVLFEFAVLSRLLEPAVAGNVLAAARRAAFDVAARLVVPSVRSAAVGAIGRVFKQFFPGLSAHDVLRALVRAMKHSNQSRSGVRILCS